MGTHPIFESDFDCLTGKSVMKLLRAFCWLALVEGAERTRRDADTSLEPAEERAALPQKNWAAADNRPCTNVKLTLRMRKCLSSSSKCTTGPGSSTSLNAKSSTPILESSTSERKSTIFFIMRIRLPVPQAKILLGRLKNF